MKKIISIIGLFVALISTASAQLVVDFSGGNDLSVGPGTAGYSFTVGAEPLTIQTLGVWASAGPTDGLFNSHEVGIWSLNHSLIADATIPAGTAATQINGFFYVNLSAPLTLQSGTYFIGAHYLDNDFDAAKGNVSSFTSKAGVTVGDAYLSSGTGFTFPDINVSGADSGFFGPNAGFTAVPEPGATAVIAAGLLLGFAAWRKFDKRQVQV